MTHYKSRAIALGTGTSLLDLFLTEAYKVELQVRRDYQQSTRLSDSSSLMKIEIPRRRYFEFGQYERRD